MDNYNFDHASAYNLGAGANMGDDDVVGADNVAQKKADAVFLPYTVKDDSVHTDLAMWQLRELQRPSTVATSSPTRNLLDNRREYVGHLLAQEGPSAPNTTTSDDMHIPTVNKNVPPPRIGADWPVAQFAKKFREEVFRGRHSEKYKMTAFSQNLTLAGRTSKLELEMDQAITGTIKQYSKLRKEYIKQRDNLPLDFLRYDVKDGKGLVYVKERATGRIYNWMNRILMHRVRRRFGLWVKLLLWFRWLRKVKRGIVKLGKTYRRVKLRRWKYFTAMEREAERQRSAVQLQKVVRGHFGRKIAYARLRTLAAHAIQMRVRMFVAKLKTHMHRRRREGAKALQRLYRWRKFRLGAVLQMQTWFRMRRSKNEFLQLKASTKHILDKWLASFLMRKFRAWYLHLQRAAAAASRLWRGKLARKLWKALHSARAIQTQWRGRQARWLVFHIFRERAARKIQAAYRGYIGRRIYKHRYSGQVCIQKYLLMWIALGRYKVMIASRNRAKKRARIRVSVRPIHGVSHIVAAVRPGRVEWRWTKEPGQAPTARATWVHRKGLEIMAFRVSDGVDYKIVYSHESLQNRWQMYRDRGHRTPGPYSKPFLNLMFDQLKVSPLHHSAQIVRTTRTERGRKIAGFSHRVKRRWFIVTVWLYNEEYCWRAFDPFNQRTYRGTVVRRELEKRLNRYDAFEELTDSDIVFPVPSKKALAWVLGKMVVYDRYAMQAFWKSPVFDEGVLILDQQEDVMAMKIQSAWRLMVARGKLFQKIKTYYRKMWDKEYQSFYYFNRIDETRSWELPMLLYRTNRWDLELIDIWDKVVKEDGAVWYFNGARDQWSRFSEAKCVNIIAAFYRKHVMGSACTLPSLIDLAKGMKFKDLVLDAYEKHPEKLSALVNMALYTHTRTHQYKTARQLYAKALKLSDANPTILYSVGLFELADRNFRFQESRWEVGMKYIADARELDHRRDKFATAEHMFFKMGVIIGANDPRSLRNWALVHQCIKQDYTTADKLYCRSLALDPYDEGTQVCYVDFLDGFKNGGIYDRSGPPISLKMESTFVREEVIDGVRWQLFANPKDYSRAHHKFWYNVDQARTRWVSPKWKARGFLEKELQIMKAKRRIVSAENRYRKEESRKKAKSRDGGGSPKKRKQRRDSSSGNGPASPAVSNGDEESEQPQRSADYIPIPDEDEEDDRYEGGSLAELLGAAPGSPIHHELTNMQQMLSTTSQRLMQLEAAQSNQPTVDELERLKSMVEEQNARIAQLMAATNMSNDPKGVNPDNAKQPGRDY